MRCIVFVLAILLAGLANAQQTFSFRLIPTTGGPEGEGSISFDTLPPDGMYGVSWVAGVPVASTPDPYGTFMSVTFNPLFSTNTRLADSAGLHVHIVDRSIISFGFLLDVGPPSNDKLGQGTDAFYLWQFRNPETYASGTGYVVANWPLPEPGTYGLVAAGLGLIAWRGIKRSSLASSKRAPRPAFP